jgi:Fur family peroxide stress response transcriptional regulator
MTNSQNRYRQMVAKLKENRCRITPQRLVVISILAETTEHPSVEQIYAEMKPKYSTTSLATVYKTVGLLKQLGEVLELGFGTGNRHYDGFKPYSHPHIMCTKCKRVSDIELSQSENYATELEKNHGYQIHQYQMNFIGVCPECNKTV